MHQAQEVRTGNQGSDILARAAEVHLICAVIESEKHASETEANEKTKNENAGRCENHPPRQVV
jgi:hypothetical protein